MPNMKGPLYVDGMLVGGTGINPGEGRVLYVDGKQSRSYDGTSWTRPYITVQAAIDAARSGDQILIAPKRDDDGYDEAVTIPRSKRNLKLIGVGARGSVFIAPSTTNATAVTNEADETVFENIGMDGDGTGHACVNRGRRVRWYGCKIEGGTDGLRATLGTAAQVAADTRGDGSDCILYDCEIAWNTNGVHIVASDHGAVTQLRFRGCWFHNNTAADFEESGGSAAVRFQDLDIGQCKFSRLDDGTEPAMYIILNDDNANSGMVWGCTFPTAINGGNNLVSTALIWVGNFHTGGVSAAQPS